MSTSTETPDPTTQAIMAQAAHLPSAQRVQLIEQILGTLAPPDATSRLDVLDLWAILRRRLAAEVSGNELPPQRVPIMHTAGVCGGSARVGNTRIPVWSLVEARRLGISDENLLKNYPSLTSAHLQAAWSYYESHRDEIERDIAEQDE